MKTRSKLGGPIHALLALGALLAATIPAQSAIRLVTNTNDSGSGSLRECIDASNLSSDPQDRIHFSIAGDGPHTISPVTPLPNVTHPVVIDGYTEPGSSPNTIFDGDNAVLKIVVVERLLIDTTNSVVRGLAIRQIHLGATPSFKGGNVIEGCFIGLDATGTNSLGSTGSGVFIQTPNNVIGGQSAATRNIISGHGTTGMEIFEAFATVNMVQGNFIGTDRTGTKAIGNTDRALVVNQNAFSNFIGGSAQHAGNVISGNLNRGITLDGFNNIVQGNFIGTDVTGRFPLGNARTGVEVSGPGNTVGGTNNGAGNLIAFNGVNGQGATTNGVDVAPGTLSYAILGNSIFDNEGLGIDVNRDALVTTGFPVLTLASNTMTGTTIRGTHTPSLTFRLELFTNPACDPSGFGEGKTLLVSSNITADAGGNFTINWPTQIPPGLFLTATANGTTEFSQCRMVVAAGTTNSWVNAGSGKWEVGANWSLNVAPYIGHTLVLVTNAGTKTVTLDSTTASSFPTTLNISNLLISAPAGAVNTVRASQLGSEPLRFVEISLKRGGAMVIEDSTLLQHGDFPSGFNVDGTATMLSGMLIVTNNSSRLRVGNNGPGSFTVSNGVVLTDYTIVGNGDGADGFWHIAGGTNIVVGGAFDLADSLTATGKVLITGGQLIAPNAYIGLFGHGQIVVSNGMFSGGSVLIGSQEGSQGHFIAAGGVSTFTSMRIREGNQSTGTVLVTSSALVQVNGPIDNDGLFTVNGGELSVTNLLVDDPEARFTFQRGVVRSQGTGITNGLPFTVGNGTDIAEFNLRSGKHGFSKGLVISQNSMLTGVGMIAGGVTNSGIIAPGASPGRIDITGALVLNDNSDLRIELGGYTANTEFDALNVTGTAAVDGTLTVSLMNNFQSVMTNGASFTVLTAGSPLSGAFNNVASGATLLTSDGYARFTILYSGNTTLRLTGLVVVDSDGDGIPNWYEDQFGLQKNVDDAGQDADGDGATNLDEYRIGTHPNDPNSVFAIVAAELEGANVRVIWNAVGGKTYRVQTNGIPSSAFADLSPNIPVPGTGESFTNYVHLNGANAPSLYYRIRVVP